MQQTKSDISRINSEYYDQLYFDDTQRSFETRLLCANLIRLMPSSLREKKVLEIGFGSGLLACSIVTKSPKLYVGVETSNSALNKAQTLELGENALFVQSIEEVRHEKFDIIVLSNVIEHIDRDLDLLRILNHYLNTNGKVMLTFPTLMDKDPNPLHFRTYDPFEFANLIERELSVDICRVRYLPPSRVLGFVRSCIIAVGQTLYQAKSSDNKPTLKRKRPLNFLEVCYFSLVVPILLFFSKIDHWVCSLMASYQGFVEYRKSTTQKHF